MSALSRFPVLSCFALAVAISQAESIERLDPALDGIIIPGVEVETLCTGFKWAEGPVWDEKEKRLLFSDVPQNTIFQWKEGDKEASIYMHPSGYTGPAEYGNEPGSNGITFDSKGQLLCCEHGDRRVSCLTPGGGKRTLADNYQGKRFNSPNDLTMHSSGAIYFTDPPYGLPGKENDPSRELPFFGVFRIAEDGEVTLITDELVRPNGIALSPDGKILYVAQSHAPQPVIMAYPVNADGSVGEGKVFYNTKGLDGPGLPDGLKVSSDGTVFTTGPDGVLVLSEAGKLLGRIHCGRPTANLAFGKTAAGKPALYITSKDRILRVPLVADWKNRRAIRTR